MTVPKTVLKLGPIMLKTIERKSSCQEVDCVVKDYQLFGLVCHRTGNKKFCEVKDTWTLISKIPDGRTYEGLWEIFEGLDSIEKFLQGKKFLQENCTSEQEAKSILLSLFP
ncbi:MAG: hypothetical protein QW083_04630 [Methanomassiliicoccales archaeon]